MRKLMLTVLAGSMLMGSQNICAKDEGDVDFLKFVCGSVGALVCIGKAMMWAGDAGAARDAGGSAYRDKVFLAVVGALTGMALEFWSVLRFSKWQRKEGIADAELMNEHSDRYRNKRGEKQHSTCMIY